MTFIYCKSYVNHMRTKILTSFLFLFTSLSMAGELPEHLKQAYPQHQSAIEYLFENHDISMSGSERYWSARGGFPQELDELEELGLIYVLKYKFGTDGIGFKLYPTKKAIELFEGTSLSGVYRYPDIEANINMARKQSRYFYITEPLQ